MKSILAFFIFILLIQNLLSAQDKNASSFQNRFTYSFKTYLGKSIVQYNFPEEVKLAHFYEFEMGIQTSGNKTWHHDYSFPQMNISAIYGDLGSKNIFGQFFAIMPNMSFYNKKHNNIYLEGRFGMGFAFFNKPYDAVANTDNLYIGSRVTNVTHFSFIANKRISPKLIVGGGLSFFHFSNGHVQIPNLGINVPSGQLSIKYIPKEQTTDFPTREIDKKKERIRLNIRLGVGLHEYAGSTFPTGGPKFPIYVGSIYLSKRYTRMNNVHLGFHYNYYTSYYDFMVSQELFLGKERRYASNIALFLGHEFMLRHFSFVTQLGGNIYNPFRVKLSNLNQVGKDIKTLLTLHVNTKLGFQYYIFDPEKTTKNNIFLGFFIKANFGQADFVETAIGFIF